MLSEQAEQAERRGPDIRTETAENTFARVVVEQVVRAPVTRAGHVEILLDAVAVHEPQRYVEGPEAAAEQHAPVVGDAGEAVGHEVLEGQANLARKHQVGYLELAEHQPDAAVEQVVVTEPGVLDDNLRVRSLLREDHVEVVADVVAERRTREQLQQVRRLEVQAGVGGHRAADRVDGFGIPRLHESLRTGRQRQRLRQSQRLVTGWHRVVAPVRHAVVHVTRKAIAEVVEARIRRVADVAADAVFARERGHRLGRFRENKQTGDDQ